MNARSTDGEQEHAVVDGQREAMPALEFDDRALVERRGQVLAMQVGPWNEGRRVAYPRQPRREACEVGGGRRGAAVFGGYPAMIAAVASSEGRGPSMAVRV